MSAHFKQKPFQAEYRSLHAQKYLDNFTIKTFPFDLKSNKPAKQSRDDFIASSWQNKKEQLTI